MKPQVAAHVLSASILAGSVIAAAEDASRQPTFEVQLHARYCDKLREGALPFVHFVRRLKPIYGYTYTDFAPARPGAPVVADCHVDAARVAEVKVLIQLATREDGQAD